MTHLASDQCRICHVVTEHSLTVPAADVPGPAMKRGRVCLVCRERRVARYGAPGLFSGQ